MRILYSLLFVLPVFADSVVVNGALLSQASANQLATWLGQGDRTFVNVFSRTQGSGGSTAFHAAVDGIGPTFILMQTSLGLVGGYNPGSWNSSGTYTENPTNAGRTAFIFNLNSGTRLSQRLGVNEGRYQTFNFSGYGPAFGGGHDLVVNSATLGSGYANTHSYGGSFGQPNVFGLNGFTSFTVGRVEAFTISPILPTAVPEPASISLIGVALGGLLYLRGRTKAS